MLFVLIARKNFSNCDTTFNLCLVVLCIKKEIMRKSMKFIRKSWGCNDINMSSELRLTGKQACEMLEEYTEEQIKLLNIDSVSNRRELLCAFFKFFRDNGEANIGMTIEQFVDAFLSTQ